MGTWRQNPVMSGGGFLFDTGAHMLNTVSDLVGEEFAEVAAWLDNRGTPVDILGSVMARTVSGAFITLSACGDAIKSCHSDVRVFCTEGILRTGIWGERLEVQRNGQERAMPVRVPASMGQWEQFLKVRAGRMAESMPAGDRAAYGALVGCHPGVGGARWATCAHRDKRTHRACWLLSLTRNSTCAQRVATPKRGRELNSSTKNDPLPDLGRVRVGCFSARLT